MLHRLLFDTASMDDASNVGAFLRMGETGQLASYSSKTIAGNVSFVFVDGDVDTGDDSIAEVGHGLETGDIVRLTSSGTLPAGLALLTSYWAIRVDADNFKLAASLADAEAGIAVDITAAAGGGNHTVTEQERVHSALDMFVVNPIQATVSGAVTVSATDLDIRDLAFATDKVDVSGSEVSLDAGTLAALENITVSATDLDIRDLAFATDKVDVSGSEVSLDAGTLAALENITVSATDLDIRDLAFATDKVDVTGSEVSLDAGTLAALENISAIVTATDLDIRDLSHTQDSVKIGDGTDFMAVNTDGSLNVQIANAGEIQIELTHNTAIFAEAETVTTSSGALVATPLANRENMWIYNNGSKKIFVGQSGVSAANGFPLFPGSLLEIQLGAAVVMHAVAESGSQDIRVLQAS